MAENSGSAQPCCPKVAAQIERYDRRYAAQLVSCAGLGERIAQLAVSHPLLFFLLATRYGPAKARWEALQLASDGSPLREICYAMGIPFSLRRVVPEACRGRPPHVQWSPAASRSLAALIPSGPDVFVSWLPRIQLAHRYGGEEFAIWLAAMHCLFSNRRPVSRSAILVLALYAWYSRYAPLPFDRVTVAPWSADMALERAAMRAATWAQQMRVICELGPEGLADPWLPKTVAGNLVFAPITTPEQLLEEAAEMRNCVASYSGSLAAGDCRLFSLTNCGTRVATIEVRYLPIRRGYAIAQMKGPVNAVCSRELWSLAGNWLQAKASTLPPTRQSDSPTREQRLLALMAPYLAHHNECGPAAQQITLKSMFAGVRELGRLVGSASISRRLIG